MDRMMDQKNIFIFGASGVGATTLGAAVAAKIGCTHVDCDDHYWAPVDPPFSIKRTPSDRVASIAPLLTQAGWVLTGACEGWGESLLEDADLIVFLSVSNDARLQRLRRREALRFGSRIAEGGDMYQIHLDFIQWANGYEDPAFNGRNRAAQERWMTARGIPILRLDGMQPVPRLVDQLLSHLKLVGD